MAAERSLLQVISGMLLRPAFGPRGPTGRTLPWSHLRVSRLRGMYLSCLSSAYATFLTPDSYTPYHHTAH